MVTWRPEWKRDFVYLHVIPRSNAGSIPNLSPFAMKVETWLRINKIPYEIVDYQGMSSKGQSPFMMFNEEEMPDSNFMTEYLSKYFKKDLYPGLDDTEKAIARAFLKMIEENTAWPIFLYRYVEHSDEYSPFFFQKAPQNVKEQITKTLQQSVKDRAIKHGIGRHSSEEVQKIGCDDIRAISKFLGKKKFMMGDIPTLVDCSLFGVITQAVCVPMNYPQRRLIMEECTNILEFVERMKAAYWPDWDEQCAI